MLFKSKFVQPGRFAAPTEDFDKGWVYLYAFTTTAIHPGFREQLDTRIEWVFAISHELLIHQVGLLDLSARFLDDLVDSLLVRQHFAVQFLTHDILPRLTYVSTIELC